MSAIQHLITEHLDIWTVADTGPKSGRGRSSANAAKVYGISKLRELILELAVRGKLVPQDASDEPASELLKRIQAEKAKLIAKGKVKKEKPLPPITENEIPLDLPQSWELVRLGDIAFSQAGFAFKSNGFNESGLGLPLIRIRDVGQPFTGTYFDGEYRDEFVVRNGDYLISMDGEFRVAKWLNKDALLNQRVSRLIFFGTELTGGFVAESLQARLRGLQGVKAYTTVDHLSGGQISSSIIGLPPIQEQHRIVAKVDELMALCDQLEVEHNNASEAHEKLVSHLLGTLTQSQSAEDFSANWQRIATHFDTLFTTEVSIDALKQTLLQLAVMGKLVPQDPNDEPASELLKRIQAEKAKLIAEGKIKKEKPQLALTDEEKPFPIKNTWAWIRLGDLVRSSDSGWSPSCEGRPRSGNEWGVLKVSAVSWGEFLPYENKALPANLEARPEHEVINGDFLVSRANTAELVARSVIAVNPPSRLMLSDKIVRLNLVDLCDKRFVNLTNSATSSRRYYGEVAGGTSSSMKNVTREQILNLAIPLPPLNEQSRIVIKVYELMTLCDQLKSRLTEASQLQLKLADVLVENSVSANSHPMHTGNSEADIDQATARTLLATEVVHQLNAETRMGRVKLQKVVNLAEYVAGLKEVASEPLRNAAGPHDRHFMDQVLQGMKDRQWYEEQPVDGGKSYQYRPLAQAGQHRADYEALWSPEQRRKISDLIALMRSWKTDQCERVATLYSAWNDLLIEGKEATEANILNEVLNRWNDSKRKFTEAQWQTELTAMKKHALLIPTGFGRRTTGGTQTLSLH